MQSWDHTHHLGLSGICAVRACPGEVAASLAPRSGPFGFKNILEKPSRIQGQAAEVTGDRQHSFRKA